MLGDVEITRAKDVKKHGEHDQSDHGSWATGQSEDSLSQETASKIQQFTRDWGGLSIKMTDGSMPDKGYMVSKPTSLSRIVPSKDFYDPKEGWKILREYEKKHSEDLATGRNYLGTWEKDGKVFLDVSQNIMDRNEATSLGASRDQLKIWDVVNQVEIDTGGTGGIEKASSNGAMERYLGNVRGREGRLRERTLGEIDWKESRRPTKVIYFDYGLKPVLKHEGGPDHDQADHGNWARGYTSAEIELIESMKDKGPTLDDLNSAIKEQGKYSQTDEQLKLIVENDQDLYNDATAGIDSIVEMRLASLQAEFPNHVYTEQEKSTIYENAQNDMIDGYIESQRDTLTELAAGMDSGEFDVNAQELIPFLNEVYAVEHTGNNLDGDERTISSEIIEASTGDRGDGSIIIQGTIDGSDGDGQIGFIQREFFKENGVWNVEHLALIIENDDYKGTGFGKEIIQQSEAWYVAREFGYIEVSTAMDGARHWARAGYDFNPEYLRENASQLIYASARLEAGSPEKIEFDSLMSRYLDGYVPSSEPIYAGVKSMKDEGFPLPANFANIGYTAGAKEWAGKELTRGLNMKYVKVLTPEGQKLMDGPIDHDGDGLIYDGTSREKPAPSGGKK
jgi:hypothetical protein